MGTWTRKLAVLMLVAMLLLAGCGGAKVSSPSTNEAAKESKPAPVELQVWSHMTEPEVAEIDKLAQEWAKQTGNKVQVVFDQGDFAGAVTAIAAGKGPDMIIGVPHDNLGQFLKAGQLAAVPSGLINKDNFVPLSLNAVSFDGKMMAVPLAMEAVALFYRTDKIKTPPKTWDEFIADAKQYGFSYDVKTFYFSYGFIAGNGGYVFKDKGNGALDPTDIGLGNEGAQKGYATIQSFVTKYKFMPPDITGDAAKASFQSGKTAMYISGPWDVDGFKKANVPFAVAPMADLEGGKKFTPFVGVYSAFVNAKTSEAKQKAAWDLMKFVLDKSPLPLFKVGSRIPVQKSVLALPEVKDSPLVAGFGASAANGVPMPNIPQMGAVWDPTGKALDLLVQNKLDPKAAAAKIEKEVKEAIAQQK